MTDRLQMWLVDEADFPAAGSEADRLRFVRRYAVLAPSSHNSQPWLFYVEWNAVEIYADRARRLPVVGNAQLLPRFGYGPNAAPTPRRPLADVLVVSGRPTPKHQSRRSSAETTRRQT